MSLTLEEMYYKEKQCAEMNVLALGMILGFLAAASFCCLAVMWML